MNHSRIKLQSFTDNILDKVEYEFTTQDLINKAFRGDKISLAEEQFVCSVIKNLHTEDGVIAYDIKNIVFCENYRFRNTYMLYFNDLNGHKNIIDFDGEISLSRKKDDVLYLNIEYQNWTNLIQTKLSRNDLLGFVANETINQIKELRKFAVKTFMGSNYFEYLKKSLTLHGKHIYLTVKEFYEELGVDEQTILIGGKNTLINAYSYVHILYRHYSQSLKQHQIMKSYHFDENIDFKNIPTVLYGILVCYQKEIDNTCFNELSIYLKINQTIYSIWFRKIYKNLKGNVNAEYFRVQTFYPVKEQKELDKIKSLTIEKTNCGYEFFV